MSSESVVFVNGLLAVSSRTLYLLAGLGLGILPSSAVEIVAQHLLEENRETTDPAMVDLLHFVTH